MIYSVSGILKLKKDNLAVIETGGIGYKVFVSARTRERLPSLGETATLFTHHHVREDADELFGFVGAKELSFFELLISISGVGPKSALAVMDVADVASLSAAIKEGRPDLLTQAAGIGRKTAERIVLELKNKVEATESEETVRKIESDVDLVEILKSLGYNKDQAKAALGKIVPEITETKERLKAALRVLSKK